MNLILTSRLYQKAKLCTVGGTSSTCHSPLATCHSLRGMTLPEIMVTVAVGSMLLSVMAILFMTTARSFVTAGNYVNMDTYSRNALDRMTAEIRQAGQLTEFSPTHLKFARQGQTNSYLVYNYNPGTRWLTEWKTGTTTTNTLLTECDQLAFSLYNVSFLPETNLLKSKGLGVNWKCSRTILGKKTTTEEMQQALIVIRNKPL